MGHCLMMRKGKVHTAPVTGVLASSLAVGSTVKLMEGGAAVEYLVVNQGKPSDLYDDSCDGTWLLRKDIYISKAWHSSNVNKYETSGIHIWLNGDFFKNSLGTAERAVIKQVKIPYRKDGGEGGTDQSGANGLFAKIFLLSGYEVGWTTSDNRYFPVDGAKLDYFESGTGSSALNKRIANYNGSAIVWYLRSMRTGNTGSVFNIGAAGTYGYGSASVSNGIRPALVLPSTALFDETTMILKGTA